MHGGAAPAVKAAAARRLAVSEIEAEVENLIAFESFGGVSDPLQVMAELAERALATEQALAARVNFLAQEDQLRYRDSQGRENLRAEVTLWQQWHKQAAHLADRLATHNWEGRRVAMAERDGALVAQAVRAILDGMLAVVRQALQAQGPVSVDTITSVEHSWSAAIGEVVPRELRALGGGEKR